MAARLIDTAQLLVRTGQRDVTEITDVLDAMSFAATTYLEGELQTTFDAVVGSTNTYDIGENTLNGSSLTILATQNDFVDTLSVTVKAADSLIALRDYPQTISPNDYIVKGNGLIMLYPTSTLNTTALRRTTAYRFYEVTYSHGFNSDLGLYDPTQVPEWLKELATQYVIYRMNSQAPFRKVQKVATKVGEPLLLQSMLNNHVRIFPHAIKPLF